MDKLMELFNSFGGLGTVGIIGILIAGVKAYKKIMTFIDELREALMAGMNINAVFQKAYADKKLDNDEILAIQESIEKTMKESKDAVKAFEEAKAEIQGLYKKTKKPS